MVVVAVAVTATSIWILYQAAFEEERARLIEAAKSHVQLIKAVARLEGGKTKTARPPELTAAVLARINDAHAHYRGFGKTGEFVMARRDGDRIVFLWEQRRFGLEKPQPVPWNAAPAEPMRRALMQMSGVVIGLDYRGVTVLAAYEPVALLGVGIVAKIDMSEIRDPFIEAAAVSFFRRAVHHVAGPGSFQPRNRFSFRGCERETGAPGKRGAVS